MGKSYPMFPVLSTTLLISIYQLVLSSIYSVLLVLMFIRSRFRCTSVFEVRQQIGLWFTRLWSLFVDGASGILTQGLRSSASQMIVFEVDSSRVLTHLVRDLHVLVIISRGVEWSSRFLIRWKLDFNMLVTRWWITWSLIQTTIWDNLWWFLSRIQTGSSLDDLKVRLCSWMMRDLCLGKLVSKLVQFVLCFDWVVRPVYHLFSQTLTRKRRIASFFTSFQGINHIFEHDDYTWHIVHISLSKRSFGNSCCNIQSQLMQM